MNIIDTTIIKESIQYELELLTDQLKEVDSMRYGFSPVMGITSTIPKDIRGVYTIIYLPDNKVVYVGEGTIRDRVRQHKRIFKNMGKPEEFKFTKVDSAVGRKMWDNDPNLYNWGVSYIKLNLLSLKRIENKLIIKYNSEFNRKTKEMKEDIIVNNPFW